MGDKFDELPAYWRVFVRTLFMEIKKLKADNLELRKQLKHWAMTSEEYKDAAFVVTIREE